MEIRTIIKVRGLTKIYNNEVLAVDNISFEVYEKEIFGFLGPNGAGKTTTINMLNTLIKPTKGYAEIAGLQLGKDDAKIRAIIGLVPQELTADDELTGMENILLQASLYDVDKRMAKERAKELLEMVELTDAANRLVKTYSGGMRRRLELVMGLIHRPKILFLDEPTLGLDVQTRAKIWEYIKMLRNEYGVTIFMTTHYMDEADKLCDRIGIIDNGKIIALGTPKDLKNMLRGDIIILEIDNQNKFNKELFAKDLNNIREIKLINGKISITTEKGENALPKIINHLTRKGINVISVELLKPSLEQVFLYLTGRKIREEEAVDSIRMRAIMRRRRRV